MRVVQLEKPEFKKENTHVVGFLRLALSNPPCVVQTEIDGHGGRLPAEHPRRALHPVARLPQTEEHQRLHQLDARLSCVPLDLRYRTVEEGVGRHLVVGGEIVGGEIGCRSWVRDAGRQSEDRPEENRQDSSVVEERLVDNWPGRVSVGEVQSEEVSGSGCEQWRRVSRPLDK